MKLVLTRKHDGAKILVDADLIKLVEPQADAEGTHVVFGPDMVRTVAESIDDISAALGAISPHAAVAALLVVPKSRAKKK